MVALYRCGRQAEALRAYQRVRVLLAEELGISPSAALVDLERRVLAQDPALDWSPPQSYADQPTPDAPSSHAEPDTSTAGPSPRPRDFSQERSARQDESVTSRRGGVHANRTSLVTIVFVDLVESTALAERVGDDRARSCVSGCTDVHFWRGGRVGWRSRQGTR